MGDATGDEDEVTGGGSEYFVALEELQLAGDQVEGLIGAGVDVWDRTAAGRDGRLSKNRSRKFCGLTCANRVNVAAYRSRRTAS